MAKYSFDTKFSIKQSVFIKTDQDKNMYIIIAIVVDAQGYMYQIRGVNGLLTLYEYEIDDFENRLAMIN